MAKINKKVAPTKPSQKKPAKQAGKALKRGKLGAKGR